MDAQHAIGRQKNPCIAGFPKTNGILLSTGTTFVAQPRQNRQRAKSKKDVARNFLLRPKVTTYCDRNYFPVSSIGDRPTDRP